jgi:protein tyrosine phosphatase (PTP) superfamily phosphohydrolase (DUF442 family)
VWNFDLAQWEMAMKTALRLLFLMGFLLSASGCYNVQRRQAVPAQPAPPPFSQPGVIIKPGPVGPPPPPGMQAISPQAGPTYTVPPQNIPPQNTAPQYIQQQNIPPQNMAPQNAPPQNMAPQNAPPAANVSPFPTVPPPSSPNTSGTGVAPREAIAQVENRWQPIDNGIKLGTPIAINENKAEPRLYPPEKTAEKNPEKTAEPPLNAAATTLPVGIPQFAMAMDNVATGLRPSLDEGLDWLKARGYRTVVFIRLPGENDEPDRKQVEKRGIKYVTLEVSPRTLTKETTQAFNRLVRDVPGQPIFIYDRDGSLAGGLWYLYFRTAEEFSDDVARIRAGSLGLREDRDGNHRDMWLAVQKFLNEAK